MNIPIILQKNNNNKMKTKFTIVALVLSLAFISCKKSEEKNQEAPITEVADANKDLFKVSLDLVIKKNDTLHLYYTEDGTINFNEESSIWLTVEGKDVAQEVTFNLPKDVIPTQFRIDFGVNKDNQEIVLNRVKFDYLDKSFAAVDGNIYTYFRPDESVTTLDVATKTLKRKDSNSLKGTSLYPHEGPLAEQISLLVK